MNGLCRLLALLLVFTAALHAEKPKMTTRVFKIPPDFLSCDMPDSGAASPAAPADPFAAGASPATTPALDAPPPQPKTPKQILEAQGITFPEGASASFNPLTGLLTITNTAPNLDLTDAYVESMHKQAPANVAYTIIVIEGPGELIREANATASHNANAAPALATLLDHAKKPGSNVRIIGDAFLETKSGTRATTEAVREHSYISDFTLDAKSRASIAKETRQIGLHLEIEPTVAADGATIETTLSLTLNAAPPTKRQVIVNDPLTGHAAEFPVTDIPGTQITTGVSIIAGSTKLIGITKPVGTPQESADILCAAFLTATLRRVEALPTPQPKVAAPAAVPSGMIFAALHAPDGLFDEALHGTKPVTLQAWLAQAGITFPSGSLIEHRDGVLRCVNTPDNIALIAAIVESQLVVFPKTIACTLHTLEAPASFLRDLTRQTLASADDSAMFAAMEAAVARGEASFIDSAFLETKSGTHASHHAACEHRYLDGFGTNAQGRPDLSFETRLVGSILEIEPTIGADSRTVELTFYHELHPTLPITRRDHFRDPASQQPFDIPVTDFHVQKTTTSLTLTKGSTKLIALQQPTGRNAGAKLWATFLKCDVVPQVAKKRFHQIKDDSEVPQIDNGNPGRQQTRTFRVNPAHMAEAMEEDPVTGQRRKDVKQLFEEAGITFPDGASNHYAVTSSQLVARNTLENLRKIELFLADLEARNWSPGNVTFTSHVLQAPGPLLRRLTAQAASKSNHRAELDELLAAVKAGSVQSLGTNRIETKSGVRAITQQGVEHTALADVRISKEGMPEIITETRNVGFKVELEAIIGADGQSVELNIAPEFHTAVPFEHREHVLDTQGRRLEFPLTDYHVAKTTTGITMPDGTVRLLSLHKPTGKPEFEKEDILQAIFITCDILRAGE